MFCGLPMTVATLPMFDAVASARRYGSGSWRADRGELEDQRREHEADRVVDEERRQHAGGDDQRDADSAAGW